jgi:hypothetical protein
LIAVSLWVASDIGAIVGPVDDHLKLVGTPQLLEPPSAKPPEELELPLEPEVPGLPLEPEVPGLPLEPEPLDPGALVAPELPLLEPELALDPALEPDAPPDPEADPLLDDPLASGEKLEWSPPEPQAQNVTVAAAMAKRVRVAMRDPSLPSSMPPEDVSWSRHAPPGTMGTGAKNLLRSWANCCSPTRGPRQ